MSLVDGVTARCLAIAARRWPADIRADQAAEWGAELHAMTNDPGAGRLTRALRRLRFAVSLASSPPVEDENGVPRGWREFLPAWGRLLWPSLVLIGIGATAGTAAFALQRIGSTLGQLAFGDASDADAATSTVWGSLAVGFAVTALGAFLFGWFGTAVSRRLALVTAPRTAWRRTLAALGAVALVGFGHTFAVVLTGGLAFHDWFGFTLWIAVCAAVSVGAVFIARGGMRWIARILGVAGGLLLLDLLAVELGVRYAGTLVLGAPTPETTVPTEYLDMALATLWFPLSLATPPPFLFWSEDYSTAAAAGDVAMGLSGTMTTYLIAMVFLVGYTVRSARATLRVPSLSTVPAAAPARTRPVPRRPRYAALAGAGAALGVWAYTVAFTTSQVEPLEADPEFMIWGFELRLAAILLAMLALAYALIDRGRPLVPAVLGGIVLLTTDLVLDANAIPDPTAFAVALAIAAGVWSGVWSLALSLSVSKPDASSARRGQVLIALLASYAAPVVLFQMNWPDTEEGGATPPALRIGTAVVTAALAALGMTAAATARVRPPSRVKAAVLIAVPAVLLAGISLAGGTEATYSLMFAGSLALPLLLVAFTVVRWDRTRRPVLRVALLVVLTLPAMVLQVAATYMGIYFGLPLTDPLMNAAGIGMPHDGLPIFVGTMLYAIPITIIAARRTAPPPKTVPARVGELTPA